MSNEAEINNLIATVAQRQPALYSALQLMLGDLYQIYYDLYPIAGHPRKAGGGATSIEDVQNFTVNLFSNNVRLTWSLVSGAVRYELRLGATWDTASHILYTSSSVANIDPVEEGFVEGTYTFWVKAINISGLESTNAVSVSFEVPSISAPNLTGVALTNNALLYWDAPLSLWAISYYEIYRNGSLVGSTSGNFLTRTELVSGTYTYKIVAVDIVGNMSSPSPNLVLVLLDPIDYILHSTIDATLTGTYSNTRKLDNNYILGPITVETWEDHFINNSWNTIQDQISAGYPIYSQPSISSGYYREVFDFGVIVNNATVVVTFNKVQVIGSTSITCEIEGSTDGVSWSSPVTGTSSFYNSVRYARIKWLFTNGDTTSLAWIYNLRCLLDIQLTLDSGNGNAVSTDSGGTSISFNKTFKQVNSLTITADALRPVYPIYTDVTTTGFKVLLFDSGGIRLSLPFSWKARGVI